MTKKSLFIMMHHGMGDLIICNGLVRHMAKLYDLVVVPVLHRNLLSAAWMWQDVPQVALKGVFDYEEQRSFAKQVWKDEVLHLGMFKGDFDLHRFDREFYRHAGLSYQVRFDNWNVIRNLDAEQRLIEKIKFTEHHTFVHDDKSRGYVIDHKLLPWRSLTSVFPDPSLTNNIFHYMGILERAKQIHCINSSFALLVDSMPSVPGQELYFHFYARPDVTIPQYRKEWTWIK